MNSRIVMVLLILGSNAAPCSIMPSDVPLRNNTVVPVRLAQFISSETSIAGDAVRFVVAEDVMVDGAIVIRHGTPATGIITEASPYHFVRGWLWWWPRPRAGRLVFTITRTTAVDGQPIRLRSPVPTHGGIPPRGAIVGRRPPLIRWAHEGARFDARVDGEYVVTSPPSP